jgi:SAM-dependent methyltransferase
VTFVAVKECRSCASGDLAPVLDLGEQPLANAYRRPDDESPEIRYPLALTRCRACSLVQLTGTVPRKMLFDSYPYFSSYSTTMVESMKLLATKTKRARNLDGNDLVVEIASNDGYLLRHYIDLGIPAIGIEPAINVAAVAERRGVPTIADYFTENLAHSLVRSERKASVVHANNVMAHVADINDFAAGIAAILRADGVAIVETPYLVQFMRDREFDTVYHEHIFYFSLTAIVSLMKRHGLVVADVEQIPVHGGSLRLLIQHSGRGDSSRVEELLSVEDQLGVATDDYYLDFAERVGDLKIEVTTLIASLRAQGSSVAGYGAAAKGTVLLNHFELGLESVEFVVDRSIHKHGLLVPGVGIPILPAEELASRQPDFTLLLAWNLADEILDEQNTYRSAGGRFVIPVPKVAIR